MRRHVHGPGADEPLVSYEIGTGSDRRFLGADERGSILLSTTATGSVWQINHYDEYGRPGAWNSGRFQYTGQAWIGELGLYDYKARLYHPGPGRFMQTDPIGYGDGLNRYAYVRADPINFTDPSGLMSRKECLALIEASEEGGGDSPVVCGPGSEGSSSGWGNSAALLGGTGGGGTGGGGGSGGDGRPSPPLQSQQHSEQPQQPRKDEPQRRRCARNMALVAGSAAYLTTEAPALIAVARGARIGSVIGTFTGPQGILIGALVGAAVGGAVYYYNLHRNNTAQRIMRAGNIC